MSGTYFFLSCLQKKVENICILEMLLRIYRKKIHFSYSLLSDTPKH